MKVLTDVLTLERPLIGLDLETTGTTASDRIVEIGLEIMKPGVLTKEYRTLVNPLMPIPHVATCGNGEDFTGHGITDAMVRDAPTFEQLADNLLKGFVGADFAGYNVRFDLKMIMSEFRRVNRTWDYKQARVIDGFRLWQIADPRSLEHAINRWLPDRLNKCEDLGPTPDYSPTPEHDGVLRPGGAHSALWDVKMATRIIAAQLDQCGTLPRDLQSLHNLCAPGWFDAEGKLQWKDGELVLGFGKWRGTSLRDVPASYLNFIVRSDFSDKVKSACRNALAGVFHTRETV